MSSALRRGSWHTGRWVLLRRDLAGNADTSRACGSGGATAARASSCATAIQAGHQDTGATAGANPGHSDEHAGQNGGSGGAARCQPKLACTSIKGAPLPA
jgi:hypothetical protein